MQPKAYVTEHNVSSTCIYPVIDVKELGGGSAAEMFEILPRN